MELTLSRNLTADTPVENHEGLWYKRDDLLAFSNGVNGKVRTSLWLMDHAKSQGYDGVVYGGSVHAPALGRVASAASYKGMECWLVIGSGLETARRHATIQVAEAAGAQFLRSRVAYNPALQKMARETAKSKGLFQVPYGVSTPEDWSPEQTKQFLNQDAPQVNNLPEGLRTLVLPFGSGNAAAGVLYGLDRWGWPESLERIVLAGIGPDRWPWLKARLEAVDVDFDAMPNIEHLSLHPGFATYNDRMPETMDGIRFHPTYEGKIVRYLNSYQPEWWVRDDSVCLWIVGGPLP